jgi:hypothetical protein
MSKLTLEDIMDVREYERERVDFRTNVMEIKRRCRLGFGPILSMMFEHRDTMHMQVQEIAPSRSWSPTSRSRSNSIRTTR